MVLLEYGGEKNAIIYKKRIPISIFKNCFKLVSDPSRDPPGKSKLDPLMIKIDNAFLIVHFHMQLNRACYWCNWSTFKIFFDLPGRFCITCNKKNPVICPVFINISQKSALVLLCFVVFLKGKTVSYVQIKKISESYSNEYIFRTKIY